jgi:hypothetical protein
MWAPTESYTTKLKSQNSTSTNCIKLNIELLKAMNLGNINT